MYYIISCTVATLLAVMELLSIIFLVNHFYKLQYVHKSTCISLVCQSETYQSHLPVRTLVSDQSSEKGPPTPFPASECSPQDPNGGTGEPHYCSLQGVGNPIQMTNRPQRSTARVSEDR